MSWARREAMAAWAAVMFFTRLPLPSLRAWDPAILQRAAAWFPWVGLIVGGIAAAVWWLAHEVLGLPAMLASGLSLAGGVVVTGAFHEDGWADVCDGFGGGYTKARVLEIMKDSRVGAFGAIGVVLMLGLKWQAVAAAPVAVVPLTLVALHILSRVMSGLLMAGLRYVAEEGKAKPLATQLRGGRLAWVIVTGVAAGALLPGGLREVGFVVGPMGLTTAIFAAWLRRRIGGYTGDCLGAAQQLSELAGWIAVVAVLGTAGGAGGVA